MTWSPKAEVPVTRIYRRTLIRPDEEPVVRSGRRTWSPGANHPHLKEDEEPRRRVQIQGDLAKDDQTKMWPSQTTTETGRDACWKQSMEVRASVRSVGADWTELRRTAGVVTEHRVVGPTAEQRSRSHWERTWRCGRCCAKARTIAKTLRQCWGSSIELIRHHGLRGTARRIQVGYPVAYEKRGCTRGIRRHAK
jgi:hypothetical protein